MAFDWIGVGVWNFKLANTSRSLGAMPKPENPFWGSALCASAILVCCIMQKNTRPAIFEKSHNRYDTLKTPHCQ